MQIDQGREPLGLFATTCPHDGAALEVATTKNASDVGYERRCPKCGRRFTPTSFAFVLEKLTTAAASTGKVVETLGNVRTEITGIHVDTPAKESELAAVKERVAEAESVLAQLRADLVDARSSMADLLPDEIDIAYVKVVRAETTQLRTMLTSHITEHGQQRSNMLAGVAIVVAVVGIVLGLIAAIFR